MSNNDYDVVIIGAGAMGSGTARNLADDHDVLVLEKGQIAGEAAGHAAGFMSNWWNFFGAHISPEATEIMHDFWEEFDGTGHFEYHNDEPFLWFVEEGAVNQWQEILEKLPDYINYLSEEEVEENWPGLFNLSSYAGAIIDERAGYFDPHTFVNELANDAQDKGAEFRTQTRVTDVLTDGGEITGVEIEGEETVTAQNVVVTAGTFTRELVSDFVDIPTRTFVFSNVRIRANRELPEKFPCVCMGGLFWRQETDGDLFVSGGEYWLEERTRAPPSVPEEFKETVAMELPKGLNGFDDVEYISGSEHTCPSGVSITPDVTPIIDMLENPNGLVVIDGAFGGVSAAPAYATAVRSLITDKKCPFSLDPFRVDRFESTSLDFDFDWVKEWP